MATNPIIVGELTDVPAVGSSVAAAFHQEIANRVVQRFANFAALNAWAAADGSLGYTVDTRRLWLRIGGVWRPFAGSLPRFRLASTVAVSLANTAITPVSWGTETFDTDDVHAPGTPTRVTIPAALAGVWAMGYSLDFAAANSGTRDTWIHRNGAQAPGAYYGYQAVTFGATAGVGTINQGSTLVEVAAGDYFEVVAYQSSGAALNAGASGASEFWGRYLGPA